MISRSDGAVRELTRSRARANTTSAAAGLAAATASRWGCDSAACKALIASSNVSPWACSIWLAALLPSPMIAARTIAPLISRRRPPRAAAAAASRMRLTAGAIASSNWPGSARCIVRDRYSAASAFKRSTLTWLASSTAPASGSSQSADSTCSSVTSPEPATLALSDARASVAASDADIGIWLKSALVKATIPAPRCIHPG